jgi:hypothetical protein
VDHASHLAIETLNASRRWVQARVTLRRVLDSKTATPAAVEKAKASYNQTAGELEALVLRLERFLHMQGKTVSSKRGSVAASPFPLREFLGMVAAGAKAVSEALEPPPTTVKVVSKPIIDVEPE